jgi:hypothetical protein
MTMSANYPARHHGAARRSAGSVDHLGTKIVAVTVLGVTYNCILSFANQNVFAQSFKTVALTEIAILAYALSLVARTGFTTQDRFPLLFLGYSALFATTVSLASSTIFVDGLRNALIIAAFTMLGSRIATQQLHRLMRILTVLVAAVLVFELADLRDYGRLLNPSLYYFNTRGIEEFALNDTGLFANALGFANRFSFGIFNAPRTSSLFLEQVSLANYAGVLCIYLVSTWKSHSPRARALYVSVIALILLSNNSRTGSIFAVMTGIGYFVYPLLPRRAVLLVMPAIILTAVLAYSQSTGGGGDNVAGRLAITMHHMAETDLGALFGFDARSSSRLADSGYPYVIYSTTIFGLLLYWLYVSLILFPRTPEQARCAYSLAAFIFINLLIGGTAMFSIKIAAPLWVLVGYMTTFGGPYPTAREGSR